MNLTVIQIGSRRESINLTALIPGASKIYLTFLHLLQNHLPKQYKNHPMPNIKPQGKKKKKAS